MNNYVERFSLVDDLIPHALEVESSTTDPFVNSRNVGLLLVSIVTVFELAIKDIVTTFTKNIHPTFGNYVDSSLSRLNGRISYDSLRSDYLAKFGNSYEDRFCKLVKKVNQIINNSGRGDLLATYKNLLFNRHRFVHVGVAENVTVSELIQSYATAKIMINCFYHCLKRENST